MQTLNKTNNNHHKAVHCLVDVLVVVVVVVVVQVEEVVVQVQVLLAVDYMVMMMILLVFMRKYGQLLKTVKFKNSFGKNLFQALYLKCDILPSTGKIMKNTLELLEGG